MVPGALGPGRCGSSHEPPRPGAGAWLEFSPVVPRPWQHSFGAQEREGKKQWRRKRHTPTGPCFPGALGPMPCGDTGVGASTAGARKLGHQGREGTQTGSFCPAERCWHRGPGPATPGSECRFACGQEHKPITTPAWMPHGLHRHRAVLGSPGPSRCSGQHP